MRPRLTLRVARTHRRTEPERPVLSAERCWTGKSDSASEPSSTVLGHPLDQVQRCPRIPDSRVITPRQLLVLVATPLGTLTHVGCEGAHRALPGGELPGEGRPSPQASHGRVPHPAVVGGVVDHDPLAP